jgi:5-formyltetrahydrofolate cyclo-ligase
LAERLLAAGRELFVPRADPRDGRLHVHPYPCPLRTLSFGLQQPPRGTPEVAESAIDGVVQAVLVLGLAFDRRGFRLGHGSGYFDRFLARRPFPAIGLAYAAQLLDELPNEPHDVPMAIVVTEEEVCRPEAASDA